MSLLCEKLRKVQPKEEQGDIKILILSASKPQCLWGYIPTFHKKDTILVEKFVVLRITFYLLNVSAASQANLI